MIVRMLARGLRNRRGSPRRSVRVRQDAISVSKLRSRIQPLFNQSHSPHIDGQRSFNLTGGENMGV